THLDITARKRAEEDLTRTLGDLEKSHSDLLSILNEFTQGTALIDAEGRIAFLSRVGERLTGLEEAKIRYKRWQEVFPFKKHQKNRLERMIALPAPERKRVPIPSGDPEGRWSRMEIEVKDDPRNPNNKMLFMYDTSVLHNLRKLLDERIKYQDLIGKSKYMQQVFEQIQQLCKVDTTVLIEGETGTGKELVARALHFASFRKAKPFIAVNCSGLTESVLHSQLFGHKRGSFTGAVQDHRGVFEEADKGTVFLDEIAGISPSVQASLLRVMDKKEISPLGESKPKRVDVRIIAASNQDLRSEVDKGRFRADLFYRIRVARILLPPLRQRREDIPLLANAFLRHSTASMGKQVEDFGTDAMKWLREYHWPGNVRELKNAVEFAVLQSSQANIQSSDLPPEIIENEMASGSENAGKGNEKKRILAALEATGGNRTAAAKRLGMSRATFYRQLSRLDINL
ncbi:MAG: sigma-54 dependent transcriptional regulator, partial [Planctomycetes bacterium]|nr:sigma-54 dependent transcriptional regulator [Planctomycetota bacterium]